MRRRFRLYLRFNERPYPSSMHRVRGAKATAADIVELRPAKGAPLKPSVVVHEFASVLRRHGAEHVRADGHYREAIREHLEAAQLEFLCT